MGGGTPRGFSPCGDVLDCNGPLLFKNIDRRYLDLLPVIPRAEECLLVPFHLGGKAVGTLWAIAHDEHRHFDAEDLRQLESLSRFASAAHQTVAALDAAAEQAQFAHSLLEDAVRFAVEVESLNAELRQGEKRFRTVFDSIDEGFCIIEKVRAEAGKPLDFRYLEANPAFAVHCGKGNVVGQTIRQAFPEETEDWFLSYDAVLSTGEPTRFERRLAEGRLLEVHAFRVEGATQGRVAVTFQDITQRKLVEEAVRESEAFNHSIIASSPDCIKVLDLEGNLLSMRSGQELLGIEDIRPFLNKSWIEFWGGEDRRQAQAALDLAAAGQTGKFVGFFRTLRGEPKWWDVAIPPIIDERHKTVRLLAVPRDITQRKQIQDSLLQRTVQFETLVNNAPIGIYLVDADFRIRLVNPIARPEFGDIPELIGRDFGVTMHSLWGSTRADEIVNRFRHALATGEAFEAPEHICLRVDRETTAYYEWQINRIPLPDGSHGVVCYFRDISERYLAQERSRQNEWGLSYATQSARLTFVAIDLASGRAQTPVNFAAVMGYSSPPEQEVDGSVGARALLDHVVADDRSSVQAALQDFFAGKPLGKIEYRVVGDDHALRWIETRWSVVLGRDGKPIKSFATNIDITDRRQAEQAMRDSEERYRMLFSSIDEGFSIIEVIFDEHKQPIDLCLLEVNPSFEKHTGLPNATGKRLRELIPAIESHWIDTYGKVAQTGEAVRFVNQAKAVEGRWFDLYACKLGGPESRQVAIVFNDISERRKSEAALRQSEERFRVLFERGPIAMYSCDRQGVIQDYNRCAVDLWGRAPNAGDTEAAFRSSFKFFLADGTLGPHSQTMMTRVLNGELPGVFDREVGFERSDGRRVSAIVNIVPLKDVDGGITGAINCFYDITERRRSEEALRASEEEFRATFENAAIGIVHLGLDKRWLRVNAAMCRLTGYTAQELTAMTLNELTHPEDLANNLVQLLEVLDDCHALVAAQAEQSGITLSFGHEHGSCLVSADRTRIKQIFVNLLSNAIKYNRPGGTVHVHRAVAAQGRVRISVQDSGQGLSSAQLAQLFQPFERLGQEAGVIEGTGIGLALSKQLVELMGGRIGVHSTPGQGSEFWVELDASADLPTAPDPDLNTQAAQAAQSALAAAAGERLSAARGQRLPTVLCVEDNAANLLLMRRLLALHSDVSLLLASDGEQGLQMARALRPDVVLMDINLPGISGLEAMTQLAADGATEHIPVIVISAHAMRHDIEMGLQAGFFRYLTKPIQADTFTEALDAALALAHASPSFKQSKALTT